MTTTATQKIAPTITVESAVDEAVARRFYALYVATFGDLATRAVARQVLHEDEFMAEMSDPRVDKHVAWDENGEAVAMCTLTRNLETVPWISPEYFAHHYPDHTERNAVYYLGFILVAEAHRRAYLFTDMIAEVARIVVDDQAMCAWDVCGYNNEVLGLADAIEALLQEVAPIEVQTIDTQTYYQAFAVGPSKMPRMRRKP